MHLYILIAWLRNTEMVLHFSLEWVQVRGGGGGGGGFENMVAHTNGGHKNCIKREGIKITDVAQKWVLGSLFSNYLYFYMLI